LRPTISRDRHPSPEQHCDRRKPRAHVIPSQFRKTCYRSTEIVPSASNALSRRMRFPTSASSPPDCRNAFWLFSSTLRSRSSFEPSTTPFLENQELASLERSLPTDMPNRYRKHARSQGASGLQGR